MDWLRIGAFALLILYHVGMFFVPWDWHVKTAAPSPWATIPMFASNAWRLPLLFLVSGFASAALLARGGGTARFLGTRSARLLVPLLFAVVFIIPPQPWVELQFKHGYAAGVGHFWAHDYFRFGTLDGIVLPTWQHLWFVIYLWCYTVALALLRAIVPDAQRAALRELADRALGEAAVLWVPVALLLAHLALSWPGTAETHALVDDWQAHRIYFAMFLFGFFLAGAERTWAGIRRWWKLSAILAVLAYAAVAGIAIAWETGALAPDRRIGFEVARVVQGWCSIVALIGLADRYWNRDHRLRPILTEAVFPFYIVHQTIIVVAGWYLLRFALPASVEFVVLVIATVMGCWLFYLAGRGVPWLRPLIGLRLARRPRSAREAAQPPGAA